MKVLFAAILTVLASGMSVFGCQCFFTPNPPCFSYGQADSIFEGVVLQVSKVKRTEENGENARRIKFRVSQTHKGENSSVRYIYTGDGGSDCGYRFKKGRKYLVYAYQEDAVLSTTYCTRTREAVDGGEDRSYFKSREQLPQGVRIFGFVKKYREGGDYPPFEKVQVQVEGKDTRHVVTDSSGRFEFSGAPPGKYVIRVLMPAGFSLARGWPLDLAPYAMYAEEGFDKGCIEANFVLQPK